MASPSRESPRLRFGTFEVSPHTGKLLKAGIPIKLPPQPFKVLLLLLDRPGEVVDRDKIRQHLWGDSTFVDFERGINFAINQIRALSQMMLRTPATSKRSRRLDTVFSRKLALMALTVPPRVPHHRHKSMNGLLSRSQILPCRISQMQALINLGLEKASTYARR